MVNVLRTMQTQASEPTIDDPAHLELVQFRTLVRAVATVVWTATPDGATRIGADWTLLTGQTADEMVGYGWLDAIHPDDRERTRDAWRTAVLHHGVYDTDYRIRGADGIYRWFNARGTPVLHRDGTIREWVGMCLAITGSKRFQPDKRTVAPHERITASQIRAARALLGWSIEQLSIKAELSPSTIARLEDASRCESVRLSSLNAARKAFETHGVVFTRTSDGYAGLHIKDTNAVSCTSASMAQQPADRSTSHEVEGDTAERPFPYF